MDYPLEHLILVVGVKGRQSGHHFVEDGPETVIVDAVGVGFLTKHLWSHVLS